MPVPRVLSAAAAVLHHHQRRHLHTALALHRLPLSIPLRRLTPHPLILATTTAAMPPKQKEKKQSTLG